MKNALNRLLCYLTSKLPEPPPREIRDAVLRAQCHKCC